MKDRIGAEFQSIAEELRIIRLILKKRESEPLDEIETRGAALSLAALYNGIERVLVYLVPDARSETSGSDWHGRLLTRAREIGYITESMHTELKAFLAFRHFVRHAYSFQINPRTIEAVLEKAPKLTEDFIAAVDRAE